ncbi:MAG: hypothetical protein ACC618_03445 [Patescibacteria group bacterium]
MKWLVTWVYKDDSEEVEEFSNLTPRKGFKEADVYVSAMRVAIG